MQVVPLVGKQAESVRLATARGNLWEGAVRSSKTVSSILAWLKYVRTGPPGPLLMVGKTERTLKRNIIDPITEMVGTRRCKYRVGAGELDLFGRLIYTAGAHDESSADKIKGMTLAGAYGDELTTWPESFFTMMGTRLSVEGAQWFGTTNPAGPTHWLKRDYLDRASLHMTRDGTVLRSAADDRIDLNRFTFQLSDNPTLAPTYVEALKKEYVGLFYRRYVLGEWVLAEGAVYDMWDPERHVVKWSDAPRIRRWLGVGVDYGTVNPFDALLAGVGADRRIYFVSEYRHDSRRQRRQMTDPELSAAMRAWLTAVRWPATQLRGVTPEAIAVDPSAASFKIQLYRDGMTAMSANNSVLDGIRTMSALMAADRLRVIGSDCPGLVEELPGYSWDDKAAAKGEDAVVKVNDHACFVAGTLVETEDGPVPIEHVRPGVRVWTRSGLRPVLSAGMTCLDAEVLTVSFSSGQTLSGTRNHPVWTENRGWTRLDALRYTDTLVTWQARSSSFVASGSAGTPIRDVGQTGSTSRPVSATGSVASVASTKRSGRPTTAPYLTATRSTTPTSTHSTTTLATSSASRCTTTRWPTLTVAASVVTALSTLLTWSGSGHSPRPGMPRRPAESGTVSTLKRWTSATARFWTGCASSAASLTGRRPCRPGTGSARTPASQRGGVLPTWTTPPGTATAVELSSRPTSTPNDGSAPEAASLVTQPTGRAAVYNLSVEGAHEYFANGVLVHNCDAGRYLLHTTRSRWRHEVLPALSDSEGLVA